MSVASALAASGVQAVSTDVDNSKIVKTETNIMEACGIYISGNHLSAKKGILFSYLTPSFVFVVDIDATCTHNVISSFDNTRRTSLKEKNSVFLNYILIQVSS